MRLIVVSIVKIIEILQEFYGLGSPLEKRVVNILGIKPLGIDFAPFFQGQIGFHHIEKVSWKIPLELSSSFLPYRDLLNPLFSLSI